MPRVRHHPLHVEGDWIVYEPFGNPDDLAGLDREKLKAVALETLAASTELPAELVMREFTRLDVNDIDAVVEFIRAYGNLRPADEWEGSLSVIAGGWTPWGATPKKKKPTEESCHLREAQRFLLLDQVLVGHWWLYTQDEDPREVWAKAGCVTGSAADAWRLFGDLLNIQMTGVSPRVDIEVGGRPLLTQHATSLDQALALQLGNVIAEGAPIKQCANDRCGNWFVRQTGRTDSGQHRLAGTKFCSASCARATGLREWRKRGTEGRPTKKKKKGSK